MTEIEPPFKSFLFEERSRSCGPTGVADLPGVTKAELDAYNRVFDGPGRPSKEDIATAERLDRELEVAWATAPETTVWDIKLCYHDEPAEARVFKTEEEANDMADELVDWIEEASTIPFKVEVRHKPYHGWAVWVNPPSVSVPTPVRRDSEGYHAGSTFSTFSTFTP
jgi:hypothetical protein